MLNPDLHLHFDTLATSKLPKKATRDGFGRALVEAGKRDSRIVVVCADVAESTRVHAFREAFPDRYIEVGVAEQNMAALAAGLAAVGKIPFIVSYAVFSPGRNWEQIRTSIALNDVPVKVIGHHAGVATGPDGATHQALEDITLMRVLPNMQVVVPADEEEAYKATLAVAWSNKPAYVRLSRPVTPCFTTPETPFELGRATYLYLSENSQVTLMGAGPILYEALVAAASLEQEGIPSSVVNLHSLKPMDIRFVLDAAHAAGSVVTLEDHQILGGVGGTVAEVLAQNTPLPIEMIAVHDRFGQSGSPEELASEYHLDREAIMHAVRRVIARR